MNELFAPNQEEALKRLASITEIYKPAYIRMEKQEDGRYLIMWEGEQE